MRFRVHYEGFITIEAKDQEKVLARAREVLVRAGLDPHSVCTTDELADRAERHEQIAADLRASRERKLTYADHTDEPDTNAGFKW